MSKKFSLQKLLGLYCSNNHWQKKVSKLFQPLSHLINACSQTKSTQERATRVRACNYVIIKTGRNLEDCEGWWLSGCRGSGAEHWRLKPEVLAGLIPSGSHSLGLTPGGCWPFFHFPLFLPHYIQIHLFMCSLDLPFGFCML